MANGVEFDEDKFRYGRPPGFVEKTPGGEYVQTGNEPAMTRWLMKHGMAKSPFTAQLILVIVVLLNIAITYFIIRNFI